MEFFLPLQMFKLTIVRVEIWIAIAYCFSNFIVASKSFDVVGLLVSRSL